ncbi:MAG TPA: GNAT family N-acetyltransferase [Bacteroidia bacterium]|nr:GNAT family N-acetyltransferase [Bacteroidia bacterium]HNT80032.1 GNAT family N-acetyltransferase [Bacteroidia bacterium]
MNSEKIIIRKTLIHDIEAILGLIKELALFEKAPEQVSNTVEQMTKEGFGKEPAFESIVAECNGQIVGMAIFFIKYSTWKGKGVYLDDIYVKESERRKGIGKMLFDEVIRIAANKEAHQLHWQVLDWNRPAIEFYKKYNAELDSEWINCKLNREQILKLSQS